jgi:glucose 1-dehydrogenase
MRRFIGKNVLVTGASAGIGEAVAVRFAQEGANVAINYSSNAQGAERTAARVREAQAASGGEDRKHILVQADVSQENDVKAMFARVLDALSGLDVLINNAGIQKPSASHESETADFDRVLGVNLRGAYLCSREAIRHFLTRGGGVIVNNSSVHEIIPKPKYLSYSISKGGIENLTKSLALEYADRRIRVNAVGPGATITPMNEVWLNDPEARAGVESHIPMGRAAAPEEMAAVFAFLASEEASYITGQTIFACGGLTLYPEFRMAWASGE